MAPNAKVNSTENCRKHVFILTKAVSLPGAWRFIYLQEVDASVLCGFESDRSLKIILLCEEEKKCSW